MNHSMTNLKVLEVILTGYVYICSYINYVGDYLVRNYMPQRSCRKCELLHNHMWQSCVEIEDYSVANFDRFAGARDQIFQALSLFFYMGRSLGTRLLSHMVILLL